jgi:hypothetical protein
MSVSEQEIDQFLMREWNNARIDRARAEQLRLASRAVDKVLREMELQGFTGFAVTRATDGSIEIAGTPERLPTFDRRAP